MVIVVFYTIIISWLLLMVMSNVMKILLGLLILV